MNRITPQMVLEAFKETGLKPMQGDYFPIENCACGIGAMLKTKGIYEVGMSFEDYIPELLGIDEKYHNGFASGFDNERIPRSTNATWEAGYTDGKTAWEAVKHLVKEILV